MFSRTVGHWVLLSQLQMRMFRSSNVFLQEALILYEAFQFRGVGPVDRRTEQQIGGNILILGTVEYSLPLYGDMLRGAFFVDVAKVDNSDKKTINSDSLRASWGFGFRAKVPFMGNSVVSVDFGFPFSDKDTDDEQTVTFNFGGGR